MKPKMPLPPAALEPHQPMAIPTKKHSLAIALAVSVVFLCAAVAISTWLIVAKTGQGITLVPFKPDYATTVKSVSFVPAATLPAGYQARTQNNNGADVVLLINSDL